MSRLFHTYGKFCASHPWEVMVSFLTLSICLFSMGGSWGSAKLGESTLKDTCSTTSTCSDDEHSDAVYIITVVRCLCLLYIYHQFRKLYKLGSKYLAGIAGLFTVFSSFIFCSGVINFLNGGFSELNKALPFFLLLMDLPKAVLLAQFALSSHSRDELSENIAQGMAILGPTLTLDALVETLSIGIGTLSGVRRMEELSYFACMSVVVNYIIFMTFFPACLSLVLELSHNRDEGKPNWQLSSLSKVLQLETERTANPVIQRVKLIMSAGLMLVHMLSRWPISNTSNSQLPSDTDPTLDQSMLLNLSKNSRALNVQSETAIASAGVTSVATETSLFEFYLRRWLSVSPEQLVMLGLVTALTIKYIFFDSKENLEQEIRSATNDKNKLQQEVISNTELDEANSKERKDGSSSRSGGDQPRIIVTSQDSDGERLLSDTQPSTTVKQRRQSSRKSSTSTNASNSTAVATAGTADGQSSVQASFFLGEDSASDFSEDIELVEKEVQTEDSCMEEVLKEMRGPNQPVRELDQLVALLASDDGVRQLTDEELLLLVSRKKIPSYKLESVLGDAERGVKIRRFLLATQVPANGESIVKIPYTRYDYSLVLGACCENVIGYMPIPLGVAGPLLMDGEKYQVPMATTEGCLVASTNRGCRALTLSGGIRSSITGDGMTRGPVVRFPCAARAAEVNNWLKEAPNHALIKEAFDSTSRFARLENILSHIAGRNLYLRFAAKTGDAMGMNMVSKGTELALNRLQELFTDMEIISLSGNFCSDKKPSAVNWIEGRGKSVVCEAQVPAKVVSEILKTTVAELVQLNISKNLIGSAVAGSIGGNNAHAANIVAAIYIATGQDPAQTVGSSNCMTLIEACGENNEDLYITCTMPSLELGTIGGGTILPAQSACLDLLGVRGSNLEYPGRNAQIFARIVCSTVLAAELSLLSALAAGQLVRSHMKHNRSSVSINASPSSASVNYLSSSNSQSNFNAGQASSGVHLAPNSDRN